MQKLQNGLKLVAVAVLVIIAIELAGIWIELGRIRKEQVKNGLYGAHPDFLQSIAKDGDFERRRRRLESSVYVSGSVSIADSQSRFKPKLRISQ